MNVKRRAMLASTAALPFLSRLGRTQDQIIRLGVLTDMGGMYKDTSGQTTVVCVQQAAEDFRAVAPDIRVEVVSADHQNRPDVGVTAARRWFDQQGVDVILDVNNSAIALAINEVVREKDKVQLNSGAVSSDLTGSRCSPNTLHWTTDTWSNSRATARALLEQGYKDWFFITADYSFGHLLQSDASKVIEEGGGRIVGSVRYPSPGPADFSSFLIQARARGAKVIGLCNAGADLNNCVQQAREFGLNRQGIKLAAPIALLTNVHGLGLEAAEGLVLSEPFYWDMNERSRAFTSRIRPKAPTNWPSSIHAGAYSAALHYLKTVSRIGVAAAKSSGRATIEEMRRAPVEDDVYERATIRQDGRVVFPAQVWDVKAPSESKGPWDYLKPRATIPASEAFRPMNEGNCPLVRG
jgi:branched-chain amino acid transport system substrate-binding protein